MIRVQSGRPRGGLRVIEVERGGTVRFDVVSDAREEVHVHGYAIARDIGPGAVARVRFPVAAAARLDRARRYDRARLAALLAPSLVPIALAYVAAHYATLLLFQAQALPALASDPLGHGWHLFGTAGLDIDYGLISSNTTWYLQVAFVVAATSPRSRSPTTAPSSSTATPPVRRARSTRCSRS